MLVYIEVNLQPFCVTAFVSTLKCYSRWLLILHCNCYCIGDSLFLGNNLLVAAKGSNVGDIIVYLCCGCCCFCCVNWWLRWCVVLSVAIRLIFVAACLFARWSSISLMLIVLLHMFILKYILHWWHTIHLHLINTFILSFVHPSSVPYMSFPLWIELTLPLYERFVNLSLEFLTFSSLL